MGGHTGTNYAFTILHNSSHSLTLTTDVVGRMNKSLYTLAHDTTHPEQCLLQYSHTLQIPLPSSQPPGHSPMSSAAFLYLLHYATTSWTWSCNVFQHLCGLPQQSPEHVVQCRAVSCNPTSSHFGDTLGTAYLTRSFSCKEPYSVQKSHSGQLYITFLSIIMHTYIHISTNTPTHRHATLNYIYTRHVTSTVTGMNLQFKTILHMSTYCYGVLSSPLPPWLRQWWQLAQLWSDSLLQVKLQEHDRTRS